MSSSQAYNAFGTLLKKGDGGSPENFTAIAEQVNIDGPAAKQEFTDVTNMQSTGQFREKLPTVKDPGTVSLTAHYLPNDPTHNATQGLYADFINGTKHNYQLVAPGGVATLTFAAYIADLKPDFKLGSEIGFTVTFQLSGPITPP